MSLLANTAFILLTKTRERERERGHIPLGAAINM